jgi:hypothetical protein
MQCRERPSTRTAGVRTGMMDQTYPIAGQNTLADGLSGTAPVSWFSQMARTANPQTRRWAKHMPGDPCRPQTVRILLAS